MARAMVRRALTDKIPFRWVTADAGYGYSKGWRFELEQADIFHVMATTRHDTVVTSFALDHPVHDLFPGLPGQKWKRRPCGAGAHGPRIFDWARVQVRPWHREDRRHWVIARRSVKRPPGTGVAHGAGHPGRPCAPPAATSPGPGQTGVGSRRSRGRGRCRPQAVHSR